MGFLDFFGLGGGDGGGEGFEQNLEDQAEQGFGLLDELLEEAIYILYDNWDSFSAGFNDGQSSIYYSYAYDALESFIAEMASEWPNIEPEAYLDAMYSAYDEEVMDRAFSVTIDSAFPDLSAVIGQAQAVADSLDFLGLF